MIEILRNYLAEVVGLHLHDRGSNIDSTYSVYYLIHTTYLIEYQLVILVYRSTNETWLFLFDIL
jgi:hypothetical protein